jgi:hypothetical protein
MSDDKKNPEEPDGKQEHGGKKPQEQGKPNDANLPNKTIKRGVLVPRWSQLK